MARDNGMNNLSDYINVATQNLLKNGLSTLSGSVQDGLGDFNFHHVVPHAVSKNSDFIAEVYGGVVAWIVRH